MKGIKQYHHFRFDVAQPGVVFRKEYADSEEEKCELLDAEVFPPPHRPQPVTPPGLDSNRKWYLYNKIREFCTPHTMDITCPQPEGESECVVQPVVQQSAGPFSRGRGRGQARPQFDEQPAAKRGRRGRH